MIYGTAGELCTIPGKYRCFGEAGKVILLNEGEPFPCLGGFIATIWILLYKF